MAEPLLPKNRLAHETSPYLQQHSNNPVDWYAWGPEALAKAAREDRPILLSIGYSACHWCHIMAHESFEDGPTAELMNKLFVNIKVDREERPDLDQIYQNAHGILTQRSGGWPLTVFLTPDQMPFFAGTYFPKTPRYGMPGFSDVVLQVATIYRERRSAVEQQNNRLRALLLSAPSLPSGTMPSIALVDTALRELKQHFDEQHGGIGNAPKFPHPVEFAFCLRRSWLTSDDYAKAMVSRTLTAMAEGGIYDQLEGGFCRYSVDGEWTIPHFEKMLYDNALLLMLYSDAWLADPQPIYEKVVTETAAWVMRKMQSPINASEGGYYSSLDADSEHEEGKFYVWTAQEIRSVLSVDEYRVLALHYGLAGAPNFEDRWHLRVTQSLASIAHQLGMSFEVAQSLLNGGRAKLLLIREQRIPPGRDEKILTGWNALMIAGMARAARTFGRNDWLASARAAAGFIHAHLWNNGKLVATHMGSKSHLNAYLDDYAFLLDALLELMQHDFRPEDLKWADALAQLLLEQFEDHEHGGFFFTSNDHETLIQRMKIGHDGAIPAGNGVAAFALQRLGLLTGELRYLEAAERALRAFKPALESQASVHISLCNALEEYLHPPALVILRGQLETLAAWQKTVRARYRPHLLLFTLPDTLSGLPQTLARSSLGTACAYLCRGNSCSSPMVELSDLISTLDAN